MFKFDTEESIRNWQVNSDAGYEIGNSKCEFQMTEQRTGLFKGTLSNEFDKPEKTKALYTGYANITCLPSYKSFYRKKFINLSQFTHFRLRIRGDGRSYMLVLKNDHTFRESATYLFMHPIYTHGGPYWQDLCIPFSKFFHVTHGRVSDRQYRFDDTNLSTIGVTCMDGVQGAFSLEIDYIGAYKDNEIVEESAYETYTIPKYISNT